MCASPLILFFFFSLDFYFSSFFYFFFIFYFYFISFIFYLDLKISLIFSFHGYHLQVHRMTWFYFTTLNRLIFI
jgi:hypothetical protein